MRREEEERANFAFGDEEVEEWELVVVVTS